MNILILTTGSISAYLSNKLKRRFEDDGHTVRHYCTDNAKIILEGSGKLNKLELARIDNVSLNDEVYRWNVLPEKPILHIDAVDWADVCVVCPADFNIIGKIVNGIADDIVSSTLAAWLGSGKKLFICEAMNSMMYANPIHLANIKKLDSLSNVRFIYPTVKKLACGDYGIGGLADVDAIANIVEGHRWMFPLHNFLHAGYREYLPQFNEPGAFGAKRKFDRHEGVDIYCEYGTDVHAVETGEVVDSYQYTGKNVGCGWWNDTWCLKVKGKSGVVTYGELKMPSGATMKYPDIGSRVSAGQLIGSVGQVLPPEKKRNDIRNHNNCMLHMELRTSNCHIDGWKLDGERDRRLLDPSPYLYDKDIILI